MAVDEASEWNVDALNYLTTNEARRHMDRGQLMNLALTHLLEHKRLPDPDKKPYVGVKPVRLFKAKYDYWVVNAFVENFLAMIDTKHKVIVLRDATVYRGPFQEFAALHDYELRQPPNLPRRASEMDRVTEIPELFEEVPMT